MTLGLRDARRRETGCMAEFMRNGEQRDVDVSQGRRRPEEVGGLAGYGTLNRAGHGVGDEDDRLDRYLVYFVQSDNDVSHGERDAEKRLPGLLP